MKEIIVYSSPLCGDCQKLKAFLEQHQISYENRDIREEEHANTLQEKTGILGVPYLVLDGEWIIGYEKGVGFTEEWAKKVFKIQDES